MTRRDGKVLKIDLGALFAGDSRQNVLVAAGDTIFVPRAPQFYVYGEVQKAGVYQLQNHMTVAQAISAGGGLTSRGSQRRIILKRRNDQGREYETSIKTSEMLQPDDVLFVKESIFEPAMNQLSHFLQILKCVLLGGGCIQRRGIARRGAQLFMPSLHPPERRSSQIPRESTPSRAPPCLAGARQRHGYRG